jgi:hypothetical protein
MDMKKLAVGAAIAASVVGGSVSMTAPAEAATFGFSGSARLERNSPAGFSTLNFRQVPGGYLTPTGTAVDEDFNQFTINDILLNGTASPWTLVAPTSSFFSGATVPNGGSFTLTSFNLTELANSLFRADIVGNFANGALGTGTLTTQDPLFLTSGATYSVTLNYAAVPTPALLPALLGMGAAALRKRKGEAVESEQETVKA